ncbi:MAG TPA: OmpA family protein [Williamwhitmania sp.]|nr:OmpA family protein [Williamwhitmania sp.]
MIGKRLLLTLLTLLLFITGMAQESNLPRSFKDVFTDAEYYFMYTDYQEALALYQQAQKMQPANFNINYRIGVCLLNISGLKTKALAYLEYASQHVSSQYQEGSYKETFAPTTVWLYLGDAYRIDNKLKEAIECYEKFKSQLDTKDLYNHDFVDQQISACKKAELFLKKPVKTDLEIINFNFPNLELAYNPVISEDGSSLFFTQHKKFYQAIYWSKKENGNWSEPESLNIPLQLEGEISISSCSADGKEIFVFVNDHGNGEVYHSTFNGKSWSRAEKLNKNINTPFWETNASISTDGKTLYFTSNRKGGYGGLDIYKSMKDAEGNWGPAENLGPEINTPYNEESPFFCEDKNTLIFTSQGHENMGGYDIFFSKLGDDGKFSTPINLGYPINTTDDNLFFCPICDQGIKGIIFHHTDNSPHERVSLAEIALVPQTDNATINGVLITQDQADLSDSKINLAIVNIATGDTLKPEIKRNGSTTFMLSLKTGNYQLTASIPGYQQVRQHLYIPAEMSGTELPVSIFLIPTEVSSGNYLTVQSVQFGFNSYELSKDAQIILEKVYSIMQTYPSLLVEVSGHTDSKGSPAYNKTLSLKRAKSVVDFLTNKGIEANRFVTRAAGSSENIAVDKNPDGTDNPDGRRFNRRASVKVIKGNASLIITEDVSIPENLKVQKEEYFTILLCKEKAEADTSWFKSLPYLSSIAINVLPISDGILITAGRFTNKGDAVKVLGQCIDGGFPSAAIVSNVAIDQLVTKKAPDAATPTPKKPKAMFTIQILASKVPTPLTKFGNLSDLVTEKKGNDGFFRYYYGEYGTKKEALSELQNKIKKQFADAFITTLKK